LKRFNDCYFFKACDILCSCRSCGTQGAVAADLDFYDALTKAGYAQ